MIAIANLEQASPEKLYQALQVLENYRQREGMGQTAESAHVRQSCKTQRRRIKRELRRRGLPVCPPPLCSHCGDSGSLGQSPDGETIYCECEMGRQRHREHLRLFSDWLKKYTDLEIDLVIALDELATVGGPR